ncbi:MAG TPA: hypothetical protein VEU08_08895, partial [Vicinamibacterales bacterium]|nr:hypothetical protein [Vicinamibacterales bacterium]
MKRFSILAFACSMMASAVFAQVPGTAGDQPADGTPSTTAAATISDTPSAEQPPAAPPAQDSLVLANGKVRIGAVFYADWAFYDKTGFGPQFVTQTNFPGPNNNDFNSFDVHRTYLNLYFSPTDHITLRITPNIYREAITGTADKAGATGAIPSSADGNLTFRLKYAYLEFGKLFEGSDAFKNTSVRFG